MDGRDGAVARPFGLEARPPSHTLLDTSPWLLLDPHIRLLSGPSHL